IHGAIPCENIWLNEKIVPVLQLIVLTRGCLVSLHNKWGKVGNLHCFGALIWCVPDTVQTV
ncbi:hypothetical protein, partial [Citrobacter sp.]|uniref:hypothetical protein n=1 Tax=Citrobacter sp. TaxID=1896336 RepID=UPI002FC603DC